MKISTFTANISNISTNVVCLSTEQDTTPIVKKLKTHFILMIDRSGSMSYELDNLLDQVNETIDFITGDDILSLIWYSGPGQFNTVIRGANSSSKIKTEVDKLRRTVGSTCFSEPLTNANQLVSEFANRVDQTSLILFTDGQPVVSWSIQEEETRSKNAVKAMKEHGLSSMTCIGYGNYYNRKFLLDLADMTDHGKILHNSRIDEFLESFKNTIGATSDLIAKPVLFDLSKPLNTLYLTDKSSTLFDSTKTIDLATVSKVKNDFFIVGTEDFSGVLKIDDEKTSFNNNIKKKTSVKDQANFFYGYASKLYYYGKRKKALEVIVGNCRDKFLAQSVMNAFTNDEVAAVQKSLDDAVFDISKRYLDGKCDSDFLPKRDALCVMDIFNVLFQSPEPVYYLPFSEKVERYSRIGKKVVDTQNAFKQTDTEVKMPLTEFSWAQDKLNLNVLISVPGNVTLNAKAAKAVDLPVIFPAKIYNTHTFVKDGSMNVKKAEFQITGDILNQFKDMKVPFTGGIDFRGPTGPRVVIDFSQLPVINQTYMDDADDLDVLYDLVKANMELQAKIRVIKAQIDDVQVTNSNLTQDGIFSTLTSDQVRVLTEHGISDKGVYSGIDRKVVTDEVSDTYEIRVLDFSLAGYKTIPAVKAYKALIETKKEPTNGPGKIMVEYHNDLGARFDFTIINDRLKNDLNKERKLLQSQLAINRQKISLIKMSKILNNDFFDNLKKDDKGILYYEKDLRMNVKSERKVITI